MIAPCNYSPKFNFYSFRSGLFRRRSLFIRKSEYLDGRQFQQNLCRWLVITQDSIDAKVASSNSLPKFTKVTTATNAASHGVISINQIPHKQLCPPEKFAVVNLVLASLIFYYYVVSISDRACQVVMDRIGWCVEPDGTGYVVVACCGESAVVRMQKIVVCKE